MEDKRKSTMKKWLCLLLVGVLTLSLTACRSNPNMSDDQKVDIFSLPLEEAYAYAVQQYKEHPESHRDLCELQLETQQIIEMDGKYYQSYVASNVDIRYVFISQPEFPDKRKATWDWYTVGTASIYSLDLLGKIDEGRTYIQVQPDASAELTEPFLSILKNGHSFYNTTWQANTSLSNYGKSIWKFAVVDMDSDNNSELAVMFNDGNILILRQDGESVYGYDFGLHAMYQINTDGSFSWNQDAGNIYGCSTLCFTDSNVETTELWRVEHDGSGSFMFYIDNKLVSEEQFNAMGQQRNLESVNWNPWIDSP